MKITVWTFRKCGNHGDTVVTMVMRCWTYEDNSMDIQEVW